MRWFDPEELAQRLGGTFAHVGRGGEKHKAVVDILTKAATDLGAVLPPGPENYQVADALAEAAKYGHRSLDAAATQTSAPPTGVEAEPPAAESPFAPAPVEAGEEAGVVASPAPPA